MEMHGLFEVWSPDEVAECLEVSNELYTKLWKFVEKQPPNPQLAPENIEWLNGRPDNFEDYALKNFWNELTEEEQIALNKVAAEAGYK
jgi:hypothetical protein